MLEEIACPRCDQPNYSIKVHCVHCGASLKGRPHVAPSPQEFVPAGHHQAPSSFCLCPYCQEENPGARRHCWHCGTSLSRTKRKKLPLASSMTKPEADIPANPTIGWDAGMMTALILVAIFFPLVGLVIGGIHIPDRYKGTQASIILLIAFFCLIGRFFP